MNRFLSVILNTSPGVVKMMTVYLINNEFIFNEETKELKKLRSNITIKLTFMRARCLAYIIQHAADEVIDKVAIAQALWGERSKFTSDASLTQTLYLIRRDLKTLGIDEFFITVPKSGIRVSSSIHIEVVENKKKKYLLNRWVFAGVFIGTLLIIASAFLI